MVFHLWLQVIFCADECLAQDLQVCAHLMEIHHLLANEPSVNRLQPMNAVDLKREIDGLEIEVRSMYEEAVKQLGDSDSHAETALTHRIREQVHHKLDAFFRVCAVGYFSR